MPQHLRICSAALLCSATLAALAVPWLCSAPTTGGFEQVAEGLWRWQYVHKFPTQGWQAEVNTFLVMDSTDAVLIDAGPQDDKLYAPALVRALERRLAAHSLRLILLTHGHSDHTGGLQALFRRWPQTRLAYHELEQALIAEPRDADYASKIPSDYPAHLAALYVFCPSATPERTLHLSGAQGDVSQLYSPAGGQVRWRPRKGLLSFHHLPGHAPGLVAYQHGPSNMLLAGDLFYNLLGPAGMPELKRVPQGFKANNTRAWASVRRAAATLHFDRAWASHDAGAGVPADEFRAWAASLAAE